jgi:formylglycine-generating enzyme required for sulfatase activity
VTSFTVAHALTLAAGLFAVAEAGSPPGMVWIPGREFVMGTSDPASHPNERPPHRVRVDGFWMDETPVTNAQFREFVRATGYVTTAERPVDWEEVREQLPAGTPRPPDETLQPGSLVFTPPDHPVALDDMAAWWTWTRGASWRHPEGPGSDLEGRDDHPVVQVSWYDAAAFAEWAGKRLPTEAEWEYAARGGTVAGRFWWGDEFRPGGRFLANTFTGRFPFDDTAEDGYAGVSPVKAFPPNGYGLYDMAGNVWNWTADLYRADAHALQAMDLQRSGAAHHANPQGPTTSIDPSRAVPTAAERVIKGGSFLCHVDYCESYRPTARRGTPPDTGTGHTGFRCVRSAEATPGSRGSGSAR